MMWRIGRSAGLALALAATLLACGGDDDNGGDGGNGTTSQGGGDVGGGDVGGMGAGTPVGPDPATLPAATGACPAFTPGTNNFAPQGITPRDVEIWVGDDPTAQDGPLVFYWHGTGSSPVLEPPFGLEGIIDAVTSMGGVVAAPHSDPTSGTFPWFLTTGQGAEDDLILADEILACAMANVGIDTTRIHSIGMSAGGLQTSQMSYRRSNYIASVVAYSGGLIGAAPPIANPDNKFAAMIMHGGPSDIVVISFQDVSVTYRDDLRGRGHFAFICDHGLGHNIPKNDGAQDAVWQFFMGHPWGTTPSPYEAGLPEGFPSWCGL